MSTIAKSALHLNSGRFEPVQFGINPQNISIISVDFLGLILYFQGTTNKPDSVSEMESGS